MTILAFAMLAEVMDNETTVRPRHIVLQEASMADSPLQPSVDTLRQGAPDPREELRRVLAAMSAAWQGRRYDSLAEVFADNMVLALPASSARLDGAHAIVESYREFMDRVTLTEYREEDP